MRSGIRERSHWLMGYGIPRATLKLLARTGDPFAQLVIDSRHPENANRLIEQIRQRGRISPVLGGSGWATADAQIVREVFRDGRFRTVKQRDRSPFRAIQWIVAKTDPQVMNPVEPPSILVLDPPEHSRLRRLVSRAFKPRAIDDLHDRIQEITDEALNGLDGQGDCDLVADFAMRIPIAVIAEMLGVPHSELEHLYRFADPGTKLISSTSPSWRDFRTAAEALDEFEDYLGMHIERLRRSDTDDSILSMVLEDGDLTDMEIKMFAGLLLGAGFITTAHAFGNAVVALVRHPEQLARLQADPEGWPNAVEEVLRYDSVLQMTVRVATEPLRIDGHLIKKGEAIFLLAGGANRDPGLFDRPDDFVASRSNAREHLGFGNGIHVCLGAALARMELQIGLRALFDRFPELTLAGTPTLNNSTLLHGVKHLPVSLGPARVSTS
ncbi:cytochrome P450 [Mycobacterium sp. RTGN5]|uniref:cytochrome P450 n=1 Tax=Mycobacterium sp. RTGN5 TaxID=3016522 RepID=UPI0029C6FA2A|nr:cytochrome P450 [Mycobacterium sp. RTGN5]